MKKTTSKLRGVTKTRLGRFACRLFGDQTGQTMMEFVVLGVLVVAAAVAVVVLFGKQIRTQFAVMATSVTGDVKTAKEHKQKADETTEKVPDALDAGKELSNEEKAQ